MTLSSGMRVRSQPEQAAPSSRVASILCSVFICRSLYALEADIDAYREGLGIGVSRSGVLLAGARRSGEFGVDGLVVPFQRRPVAEVLAREIDAGAVDADLAREFLRHGVADREVFQPQVGEILDVAVVRFAQRAAGIGVVAARTGEVGVAVVLGPALRIEILVDERRGRECVGAPEVVGRLPGGRIPVAAPDALEKGRCGKNGI